jgi:hypothetical protein
VVINSATSYIWLPTPACKRLEQAFNLTWNETENLYLLDEYTYENLRQANPTFKFTFPSNNGKSLEISLPYAAMDLAISLPLLSVVPRNQSQKYLPIRRSEDDQHFTVGRVFLQEVYLRVDYHTGTFQLTQALWPDNPFDHYIINRYPAKDNSTTVNSTVTPARTLDIPDTGLTRSQRRGIAGGVVAGFLLITMLLFVIARLKTGTWWPFSRVKRGEERFIQSQVDMVEFPSTMCPIVEADADPYMLPKEMYASVESSLDNNR